MSGVRHINVRSVIRRSWFLCCGWRSVICWADNINHLIGGPSRSICERHDRNITDHAGEVQSNG